MQPPDIHLGWYLTPHPISKALWPVYVYAVEDGYAFYATVDGRDTPFLHVGEIPAAELNGMHLFAEPKTEHSMYHCEAKQNADIAPHEQAMTILVNDLLKDVDLP